MRLLIITQKVDKSDPILGFFHRWVEEFSKHCQSVVVICLFEGSHSLPANVRVLSLGKEEGLGRFWYILNFYKYIWQEKGNYDKVFVHMSPEYVVLGGILWRAWGKRVGLWYVHRQSNLKLWLATKLSHHIFTSAKESFSLATRKLHIVGHGIDTDKFKLRERDELSRTLLHVGRITPIKHCEVLLATLSILRKDGDEDWKVEFVGEPTIPSDCLYLEKLKEKIREYGLEEFVSFSGSLTPEEVGVKFSDSFASVNLTPSGGMDKVVLESLASGCPAFTSNPAFSKALGDHKGTFTFSFLDAADLAYKIRLFKEMPDNKEIVSVLSKKVRSEYDVTSIVVKIASNLNA